MLLNEPMWLLALFLMVPSVQIQTPCLQVSPASGDLSNCKTSVDGSFRLNGKIVVDKGEVPLVDVRLKDDRGQVLRTAQNFANGTFYFDGLALGRYSIEVIDSRFLMATVPIWWRDPADSSAVITIRLKPNTGDNKANTSPDLSTSERINSLKLDARVPAAAVTEFEKGLAAVRQRAKNDPPEDHFKKAIAAYPDFYDAYYELGLEQSRQHQTPAAIQSMTKAVALKPTVAAPLSALGRFYVEGGEFPKAVETFSKIPAVGSFSAEDRYNLGVAFMRLDNTEAAQQSLELAISLAPGKNPAPYVELANAYSRNGNPTAAFSSLEDYLRLFPNDRNHKVIEDAAKKLRDSIAKSKP
jgi:Tfp pilus assembly protein PilF